MKLWMLSLVSRGLWQLSFLLGDDDEPGGRKILHPLACRVSNYVFWEKQRRENRRSWEGIKQ